MATDMPVAKPELFTSPSRRIRQATTDIELLVDVCDELWLKTP